MTIEENKANGNPKPVKRIRSPYLFPAYNFTLARQLAERVEVDGAGSLSDETLAISLNLSAKSSGFQLKTLTARQFGLLTKQGDVLTTTPLAKRIFKATSEQEKQSAMTECFLAIPLFREVASRFKGQPIPQGQTLRNILEREFGIDSKRVSDAERVLLDSARDTGVLLNSGGTTYISTAKTIVPSQVIPERKNEQPTQNREVQSPTQNDLPQPDNFSMGKILPVLNEEDLLELDDNSFKIFWGAYGDILRKRAKRNKPETK